MKLINKSRGTGKTTQLIFASAITGFRIITSTSKAAKYIESMAKTMGLKIPKPMSDIEYRNRRLDGDHTPILIDELPIQILDEALELYFNAPVVAATMTVPIDDDSVPPILFTKKENTENWIKCSDDNLPDLNVDVLGTVKEYDDVVKVARMKSCLYKCGWEWVADDIEGNSYEPDEIIAWMPLPEGYKEDTNDK